MSKKKNYLHKSIKKTTTTQKIIILVVCAIVLAGTIFYLHYKDQRLKAMKPDSTPAATKEIESTSHETTTAPETKKEKTTTEESTTSSGNGVPLSQEERERLQQEIEERQKAEK